MTATGRLALTAALALAACAKQPSTFPDASWESASRCGLVTDTRVPATIRLGPDVNVTVPCGGEATAAIASFSSASGTEELFWTVTTDGDPRIFLVKPDTGRLCPRTDIVVVFVRVAAPATASNGESLDATATFAFQGGDVASGTVKIHATVLAPELTIEPAELDFGDAEPGARPTQMVTFHNPTRGLVLVDLIDGPPPFLFRWASVAVGAMASMEVPIDLDTSAVGTFAKEARWRVPGTMPGGLACELTKSVTLRARVVERGDGGADAADAEDP